MRAHAMRVGPTERALTSSWGRVVSVGDKYTDNGPAAASHRHGQARLLVPMKYRAQCGTLAGESPSHPQWGLVLVL